MLYFFGGDDLKDYMFNIRISKDDLNKIKSNAEKANMTTSAYLINRALNDDKIIIIDDLRPLCYELRKIGVNLNQLTMLSHRGQLKCVNLTSMSEEVKALWQPLNLLTEKIKHTVE